MKVRLDRSLWVMAAVFAVLALAFAGCSDDDGGDASPSPSATESAPLGVTVTGTDGEELTLDAPPERVVALAPSFTEILCAVDACDSLAAVDENSNYPPQVADLPALSGFDPSVEGIASHEPDLVVISFDPGGLKDALEGLGLAVLLLDAPASLDGVYEQIETLGQAAGKAEEAAQVVSDMRSRVGAVVSQLPAGDGPRIFHELDTTLFSVGPGSFIGDIYDVLGAENIANATGSAFPQMSNEAIIDADPEVIILADEGAGETPESVAARPGWDTISAVQNDRIHGIDPDLISRPAPRIVEAIEDLARLLYPEIFA